MRKKDARTDYMLTCFFILLKNADTFSVFNYNMYISKSKTLIVLFDEL